MKTKTLGKRNWFNLMLFGLMGQIAWNVENMYFNTFLYNGIYSGAEQGAIDGSMSVFSAVNIMVSLSAITAVVTTIFMGTLSDRMNKRKLFISVGYIFWGVVTAAFGLISRDSIASLFNITSPVRILMVTVWAVIIMDCIMTFIGSTSNDAAFNAWVTDITNVNNRGVTESVLALMPIFALLIVAAMGMLVEGIGYSKFFLLLGATVSLCGVLGIFTLKEPGKAAGKESPNYFKDLLYTFRPSVVKKYTGLYLTFAAICIFSIAINVFFPYLLIYVQHTLGLDINNINITPKGVTIALAALVIVVGAIVSMGKLIDRFGKQPFLVVSILLFSFGLYLTSTAKTLGTFALFMIPAMAGYGLLMIMLNASVRDFTPEGKAGQFQGIRMVFLVLIPMLVGPTIGNIAIQNSQQFYMNEYGVQTPVPTSVMFAVSAIIALFIFIPLFVLKKKGLSVQIEKE